MTDTAETPTRVTYDFEKERDTFEQGWDFHRLAELASHMDTEHGNDVVTFDLTRQELAMIALGMSGASGGAHTMGLGVLKGQFLHLANRAYRAAEV